jgi:S1-C subfamily serine protease
VVCLISEVSPGSDAQRLGLKAGDVIAEIDHNSLATGGRGYACAGLSQLDFVSPGQTVAFTVLRDGTVVEHSGTKPNGKFGFRYVPAPVISPEKLAKH